jgi:hypothetical protein
MLLNVTYKIYAILLNKRLSDIIESKLGDFQMGFQLNRSTINNIFIVRLCKQEQNYRMFNQI